MLLGLLLRLRATRSQAKARARLESGRYAEAAALFNHSLELTRRAWPPDHPQLLMPLSGLSVALAKLNAHLQAEQAAEQALAIAERSLGPEAQGTRRAAENLADIRNTLGAYTGACEIYERLLFRDPDSPSAAGLRLVLARLCIELERLDQGWQHAQRLLQDCSEADRGYRAGALDVLGIISRERGEWDQSQQFHQQALEVSQQMSTPHNLSVRVVLLANMGTLHRAKGDTGTAAKWLEEACALADAVPGGLGEQPRSNLLHELGELAAAERNWDDAEMYHRRALEMRTNVLHANHPVVALSYLALAEVAAGAHKVLQSVEYAGRASTLLEASGVRPRLAARAKELMGLVPQPGQKVWG